MGGKNIITFDPTTEECSVLEHYPTPSKKHLPDWYKKIPGFSNGDDKLKFPLDYGMPNSTIKKCVPLKLQKNIMQIFYLFRNK